MITSISIKNFRSIEGADVPLGPLTILYGATSAGKSSLLYAPLVLRNFILNANRQADGYLHLGFMDLGGFEECVFGHDASRFISVAVQHEEDGVPSSYGLEFNKTEGTVTLSRATERLAAKVAIPYALNQNFPFPIHGEDGDYTINWNGITCAVVPGKPAAETQQHATELAAAINKSSEAIKAIDMAPHRRGFYKPNYSPVAVSTTPTSEDEVASLIINDPNMAARISAYAEEIVGRDFRLHVPPGTSTAFFKSTEKKAKMPALLVNEGFGVNQVIYLLAKMLRPEVQTILIEEPEVHLHPTVLRSLARALCTFTRDEGRQVLLATHSELFVSSVLAAVTEGLIPAADVKCHLVTKEKRTTSFHEQEVTSAGQIEGGLSSFIEAEREDIKKLLGVK